MFAHDCLSTSEVGARGLALTRDTNSHILVVLDGMVVNEQGGGAVYLHDIPIEVIDHIEFILGPGSVLYGGQAMLGVVNIVTKVARHDEGYRATASFGLSPPRLDAAGSIQSPGLTTLGLDNRYSLGVARTFSLFKQPAAVVALAHYSDFKGPQIEFAPEPLPKRFDGQPAIDPGPRSIPGAWGGPVNDQWFSRTVGAYVKVDVGDLTWSTNATKTLSAMPQMDLLKIAWAAFTTTRTIRTATGSSRAIWSSRRDCPHGRPAWFEVTSAIATRSTSASCSPMTFRFRASLSESSTPINVPPDRWVPAVENRISCRVGSEPKCK